MELKFGELDAHVWYRLTASMDDAAVARAVSALSEDERARYEAFYFFRDRRDFAAAHELLRKILPLYQNPPSGGWSFVRNSCGKPSIDATPACAGLAFNIAHTDGLVACAVATGTDIGVDVEVVRGDVGGSEIARRYFCEAEALALDECPDAERPVRFIEFWTLKEAYIKAIGTGLSCPLDGFAFRFEDAPGLGFAPPPGIMASAWQFALFAPSDRHRLAVAIRCDAHPRRVTISSDDAGGLEAPPLRMSSV